MRANRHLKRTLALLIPLLWLDAATNQHLSGEDRDSPGGVGSWEALSTAGVSAVIDENTLALQLEPATIDAGKVIIPRLCAPIRSIGWKDHPDAELQFLPEPEKWIFSWESAPAGASIIEVHFDKEPLLPADSPAAAPAGDGSVMLHACQARTFGEKLRFEPQWFKNTVGYWTVPGDYATWDLIITQPGTYSVAVLQGCGKGQGGSEALITLRQGDHVTATLPFETIDTGHFQNFRWSHLGAIEVTREGTCELRIEARRIANVALFDVRAIHLVRQATTTE